MRARSALHSRSLVLALVAAAAAALIGAAPAVADDVVSAPTEGSDAAWWTPERLAEAAGSGPPRPAPLSAEQAPPSASAASRRGPLLTAPQALAGSDAPFRLYRGAGPVSSGDRLRANDGFASKPVDDPSARELRMHGRIFFRIPGKGVASCSGTAINSNRANLVLTAGHCVHTGGYRNDWHTRLIFIPAYDHGEAPFGIWEAKRAYATGNWVDFGDVTGDVAVVETRPSKLGRLQDAVGARGVSFNRPRDQRYTSYGYPASAPFDGETERFCRSGFGGNDPDMPGFGPAPMRIPCDMNQGSSGGGWVINDRFAVSVNSYLYVELQNELFGPYFGDLAKDIYKAGLETCRGRIASHVGTSGRDRIVGTPKRDVIFAGKGRDTVRGGGGGDLICGGGGKDELIGQRGQDRLLGEGGRDRLRGGLGRDRCNGGPGRNRGSGCEIRSSVG